MGNKKKLRKSPQTRTAAKRLADRLLEIQNTLTGRHNGYLCETCGKGFLTLDINRGTTPTFSPCFATEGCQGKAVSMGYPDGEPPAELGDPIIYWYKPRQEEMVGLSFEDRTYVEQGGLIRKATEVAPPWVKTAISMRSS